MRSTEHLQAPPKDRSLQTDQGRSISPALSRHSDAGSYQEMCSDTQQKQGLNIFSFVSGVLCLMPGAESVWKVGCCAFAGPLGQLLMACGNYHILLLW